MTLADMKLLWGRAASSCSICQCRLERITEEDKVVVIGEAAHIVAESLNGPRGRSILNSSERNSYLNLILLCPNCHRMIDRDLSAYPIEKVHMLKAAHELRQQGCILQELENYSLDGHVVEDMDAIVAFASQWMEFLPFCRDFQIEIESYIKANINAFLNDDCRKSVKEWQRRRDQIRELLFRANEQLLVVTQIPDWERLIAKSQYISNGHYVTPFSYILDFRNPVYMVAQHGRDAWEATNISHEFLEYLAFKHPAVKELWEND